MEKQIQTSILKYLNSLPGCMAVARLGAAHNKGQADIYGSLNGQHFEIEVKQPGAVASKLQVKMLEKWNKAGAVAFVAHSVDDVKNILVDKPRTL